MRKAHAWAVSDWGLAIFMGFPGGSDGKESTCNMGDMGSIPGLGRSPGGGHGNPLQYSCLENPHEQRSLAGYGPGGCKESDMPEWLSTAQHICIYIKTTLTYSWMKATVIKHYKWPKTGGGKRRKPTPAHSGHPTASLGLLSSSASIPYKEKLTVECEPPFMSERAIWQGPDPSNKPMLPVHLQLQGYWDLTFQSDYQSSCSGAPCISHMLHHRGQPASMAGEWPEHLAFELYIFIPCLPRTAFWRSSTTPALKHSTPQNAALACATPTFLSFPDGLKNVLILHQICKKRWSEWALRLNPQEVADPACWFLWKRRYFAVTFHLFCCLYYARIMRIWRTRLTESIPPLIGRVWSIKGNRKSISKLS